MDDPVMRKSEEPIARATSAHGARAVQRRLQRARPSGRYEIRPTKEGFGIYPKPQAHMLDPMGADLIALGGNPRMMRWVARCVCEWYSPAEQTENEALASFRRHESSRQHFE